MSLGIFHELQTVCVYVGVPVIVVYSKKITALIEYGSGVSRRCQLLRAYRCVELGVLIACFRYRAAGNYGAYGI